ncbi:MAG TPA: YdcF family protein [bacterium]|nr:YdcF family protein [bacterium]
MLWRWIKRIFKAAFVVILLVAALGAVACYYPEKFLCVDSGKKVSAEVIVVLGGGLHERPERAAELFKQHAAPRILISGAGDDWINRFILLHDGVPGSAIQMESNSTTTKENAEFTIKLLREQKVHSVILVTSWYHARRALKTFEHYAPEIRFYSRPSYYAFDRAEWTQKGNGKRMRLEFLKLPGYWIRYGVNPF